ncbi:MAG: hypothetical protein GEEBNDBF_02438 [bacterium]|nr:hypothetical protein [bacterium]
MTLLDELRSRREEILAIAQRRGVRNIRIFGSAVRGEERPESDIDLLVEMDSNRSYLDLGGFAVEVGSIFSRRCDATTERMLHQLIRDQVLGEAVPL